ncbi:MAG: hypothetical protein ACLTDV_00155 [Eubacterium sp.]
MESGNKGIPNPVGVIAGLSIGAMESTYPRSSSITMECSLCFQSRYKMIEVQFCQRQFRSDYKGILEGTSKNRIASTCVGISTHRHP